VALHLVHANIHKDLHAGKQAQKWWLLSLQSKTIIIRILAYM